MIVFQPSGAGVGVDAVWVDVVPIAEEGAVMLKSVQEVLQAMEVLVCSHKCTTPR